MADKIQKLLAKLSKQELKIVEQLLESLISGNLTSLDIKQLKGHSNVFRARKARIRIIYTLDNKGTIKVLSIARRDEKTYKSF